MTRLDELFPAGLVERLGWTLVHSLWQLALVALLLAVALAVLRRRSPQARYAAGCTALAAAFVLPAATFFLPGEFPAGAVGSELATVEAISSPPSATVRPTAFDPAGAALTDPSAPIAASPAGGAGGAPPAGAAVGDRHAAAAVPVIPPEPRTAAWMPAVVAVWLAGVCCLALWNLGGWVALRRLRTLCTAPVPPDVLERFHTLKDRLGVARPVRLLRSALVSAPVAMGWLRPIVLVPASALTGLTPQQLEAILAHELAHVRRHDYLVNLVQVLGETLLFCHPALWWISRRLRVERELCCDDVAATLAGSRVNYADALVTMEGLRGASSRFGVGPALAVGACDGGLLQRVRRLLGASAPPDRTGRSAAAALLIPSLLIALIGGVAGIRAAGAGDEKAAATPDTAPPLEAAAGGALADGPLEDTPPPPSVTDLARVPSPAEQALLERVRTSYRSMRDAIRSVEYDFTDESRGHVNRGRYARDGERLYVASLANECAWDGRILHQRRHGDPPSVTRTTDKERFDLRIALPEIGFDVLVGPAIGLPLKLPPGFGQKPDHKFRFLGGKEVEDEVHGNCIELEFAYTSRQGEGTLRTRHARRHRYAPVYYVDAMDAMVRSENSTSELTGYSTEVTVVRCGTIGSGDDAQHFPVQQTSVIRYTPRKLAGFTRRQRVDEETLKINQPIPRARFVLRPWPNARLYDADTQITVPPKDPGWSPEGKVGFPWAEYYELLQQRGAAPGQRPAAVAPAAAVEAAPAAAPAATPVAAPADEKPRPALVDPAADSSREPTEEEKALFERVKKVYGQARAAIESVQYDYSFDMGQGPERADKGRYARSGERVYSAVDRVWRESAWDGRRVYERAPWNGEATRLLLREKKEDFQAGQPLPETGIGMHVIWALGFDPELEPGFRGNPMPTYRFRGAREVEDKVYGECVELKFDVTSEGLAGTMRMRHARRYDYAPVHRFLDGRLVGQFAPKDGKDSYTEELTDVRYATVKAEGADRHFPVEFKLVVDLNKGQGVNRHHWRIDEATLKINEPIPRSRFVLKAWPNSDTYDFATRREVMATDPNWSPVGKVDFPWTSYVERPSLRREREKQVQ